MKLRNMTMNMTRTPKKPSFVIFFIYTLGGALFPFGNIGLIECHVPIWDICSHLGHIVVNAFQITPNYFCR